MTIIEQAEKYLAAIPPSISGQGGHNQAMSAARALKWGFNLSDADAMSLLLKWNQACQPPWSQAELEHKLREADTKDFGKPRGYLLTGRRDRPNQWAPTAPGSTPPPPAQPALPAGDYDVSGAEQVELPNAMWDGFEKVLRSCFQPGEGVRVMSGITEDGLIGCDPNGGVVLSREEWLAKLEEHGDINGLYYRLGGPAPGVYLGINPMKQDGRGRDTDVTSYRHVLLEFDNISLEEQWLLYTKSRLPCAAVIYSGGKSLHAWVKINAKNRKEYDERVNLVYNHFAAYKPDAHNKNPSRFSRCPDAKRGDGHQLLMALDIGAPSYTEWAKELLVQGIGTTYDQDVIINYEADHDGRTVAGNRWLRKGGSCILAGPSGVGKSSLGRQMAICWALGRPCFGIAPMFDCKILMIQAENDLADLHDMDLGIYRGLGILDDPEARNRVKEHLVTNHNVADTGREFIIALQKLVDHHQPDLVIVDPLLSFIGDDISKQEVVGQFCRNWLNPILAGSSVAFLGIHHTGKPVKEIPLKKGQSRLRVFSDLSYGMLGSSELTNWARAILILNELPEHAGYELVLTKRGKRAGAVHPNGNPTRIVHLQHHQTDIFWNQTDPPEEPVTATSTPPAPGPAVEQKKIPVPQQIATANLHEFLACIPPEGERSKPLARRLEVFAANALHINIRGGSVQRSLDAMVANGKLTKKDDGKVITYIKGPNA